MATTAPGPRETRERPRLPSPTETEQRNDTERRLARLIDDLESRDRRHLDARIARRPSRWLVVTLAGVVAAQLAIIAGA